MPDVDLKPLEEIFRAKVFAMLKEEGKIDDDKRGRLSYLIYEFFDDLSAFNEHADAWPGYDESCIAQN